MNSTFKTNCVYPQAFVCKNPFPNIFAKTVIFQNQIKRLLSYYFEKIYGPICVGVKLSSQQLVIRGVSDV